jgi:polyphosphate:AMP phosphotransferase
MFDTAKLKRKLSREDYEAQVPQLRERLLDAQFRLRTSRSHGVLLLITGPEGAGKGDALNRLLEWMDARGVQAHALGPPSQEETERPPLYRYWKRLPARGTVGIVARGWYGQPILERASGVLSDEAFERHLHRLLEFEHMLVAERVKVVKIALHVSKKQQEKRFKQLERDPDTAWRVTRSDWRQHRLYAQLETAAAEAMRVTSTAEAPWHVVSAAQARYRDVRVAEILADAMEAALAEPERGPTVAEPVPPAEHPNVIEALDLSRRASPSAAKDLKRLQQRLGRLAHELDVAGRSAVVVFEGMDAAGKGGAIRRVVRSLDARSYRVIPIGAPTDEERAHPYLWRFWRQLPRRGRFVLFDRSWYGRVLVERVEGFASPDDWRRGYREINAFEEALVRSRIVLVKFWLAISPEEQLRRFEKREATGYKRYKITEEDWRNRAKWEQYVRSACDMVERTSTELAPWTLVEAEDKQFARVKVLSTLVRSIEGALGKRER